MSEDRLILTIGLIGGTGQAGPALAGRWAKAGYNVLIGSRQAEKAQSVAVALNQELELETIQGLENSQAVSQADIAVLTVEQTAHAAALESVKAALQGKILVDATARVDFRAPAPPAAPAAARQAQTLLGDGVRVVAAFQTAPAFMLKKYPEKPLEIDVLVCADDVPAAEEVIKLANGAGLKGYYAGPLDNAVVVEGLSALMIAMNKHYKSLRGSIKVTGIKS
jgi:8-hydroxy-5-deazaflavin:NADPH oxidoreductase